MRGSSLRARASAKQDAIARRLCRAYENRLAVVVQQPFDDATATAQQAVHASARQPKRADRTNLYALFNARNKSSGTIGIWSR